MSIVIHEWAHGAMAYCRGDLTAWILGRLSPNPLKHIDPFGTIILPILLYTTTGFAFGWAKPVPIDQNRLYRPRSDMILVALAGPLSNFILAFLGVWWMSIFPSYEAGFFVMFNIVIGTFNLLPILPLDGGRVLGELLPRRLAYSWYKTERFGMFIVIFVIVILPKLSSHLSIHTLLDAVRKIILNKYLSVFQ
jgi:Zn-dependent protease